MRRLKFNISLTQMEYVLSVAKWGHFAKAAEACSVTQPTLSMQIQKLEEDLDVVIFDRGKKPILATDIGKKLIQQMQSILQEARRIEGLVETHEANQAEGKLTLGVIPTISPYLLPRLLPVLEKTYPRLHLKIQELQTEVILESLEHDEIDVGLLAIPVRDSKMHEFALYFEPLSLLCPSDHEYAQKKKMKAHTLKTEDLWLLEEGHCFRDQVLDICSTKKNKPVRTYDFESGNLETLKNLVSLYGGYTLVPQLATDHLRPSTVLIPFERPIPARQIGLAFRREHYKIRLIEALGDCILSCLPDDLRKLRQKDLDILPV